MLKSFSFDPSEHFVLGKVMLSLGLEKSHQERVLQPIAPSRSLSNLTNHSTGPSTDWP